MIKAILIILSNIIIGYVFYIDLKEKINKIEHQTSGLINNVLHVNLSLEEMELLEKLKSLGGYSTNSQYMRAILISDIEE
ncbi:MAG: hypothetical protein ACRC68_17995 [Clostridium sp.]